MHDPASTETASAQHWLSSFQDLAKEIKVDIVVGTIVERAVDQEGKWLEREVEIESDETGEKRTETRPVLENVSTYIDWNGEIVGRYKKRNLWWPEKDYLTAGDEEHQVFETRFGKVGLLVCTSPPFPRVVQHWFRSLILRHAGWDLAWPRAFEPLLLRGAEMIIAPTYWTGTDGGPEAMRHNPTSESDYLDVLVKARAWDNECAILVSRFPPECEAAPQTHGRCRNSSATSAPQFLGPPAILSGTKRPASAVPKSVCPSRVLSAERYATPLSSRGARTHARCSSDDFRPTQKGPQEEIVLVDLDLSILEVRALPQPSSARCRLTIRISPRPGRSQSVRLPARPHHQVAAGRETPGMGQGVNGTVAGRTCDICILIIRPTASH